ncbi:MAG: TIGR03619 family F420-dependent LLM class oxidoreductase [Gammaproteobacteria bacterium]|nr:TIGR03619 family F420-dependent LLM class oxidoreductase [Gammaproteobacteria bacterium]
MHHSILNFPTDYSMPLPELAREAEARGLESIWLAEHSHIPVARTTPYPLGGDLPKMYYGTLDPFVALAAAASVTSRIRLATGICLVVQRDPIHTAKQVASLDQLCGGRFLFGVGAGWNLEEMADHGTDPATRFALMRERIEAMQAIWTQDKAEYHGRFVDFDPIFQWPKPAQQPYPPIHVGGSWPGAAKRAVQYGNGWMPILGADGSGVLEHLGELREMVAAAGRDPAAIEISIYFAPPDPALLEKLRDAGIARVIYGVPSSPREEVLPILDQYTALMHRLG